MTDDTIAPMGNVFVVLLEFDDREKELLEKIRRPGKTAAEAIKALIFREATYGQSGKRPPAP